jgi:hypothetical protein
VVRPKVGRVFNDEDLAVLAMERRRWNYQGAKATAVHRELGLTLTAYYQRLSQLLDRPEALQADPVLVHRLQRLRDARRQVRR